MCVCVCWGGGGGGETALSLVQYVCGGEGVGGQH